MEIKNCPYCDSKDLTIHLTTPQNGGKLYADEDGETYDIINLVVCNNDHNFYISAWEEK